MSRLLPALLAWLLLTSAHAWAARGAPSREAPVVLVPGFLNSRHAMDPLARRLRAAGRTVYCLRPTPNGGQVAIETLAAQLASFAHSAVPSGRRFDLVGFSMGGLVCRYYVQRLEGLRRVRHFVTVSTPHAGTALAWLVPNPGCREMRPGSAFLRDLARDAPRLTQLDSFASLWSPLDLVILPPRSSVLPQAKCERLWCLAHPLMIVQPSCQRAIVRELE